MSGSAAARRDVKKFQCQEFQRSINLANVAPRAILYL